jgi:hypothetical protein
VCWQVECISTVLHHIEQWSRPGDIGVLTNRACERAEDCAKARQVVVA